MSIQQSINQMLMTAQVGAGFYAHSPSGQRQAEIKKLERNYKRVHEKEDEWDEPFTPEGEPVQSHLREIQMNTAQRLYELDPSEERYRTLLNERDVYDYYKKQRGLDEPKRTAETEALESISARIDTLTQMASEFNQRKSILSKSARRGGKK